MSAAFGIRFGATTASLAVFKDGKTYVVANENGDRVTPAIVAFTAHDQTVGLAAKQGLIRNATNTVVNVKHALGKTYEHPAVQQLAASGPVKIINQDGLPVYQVTYKEKESKYTPKEIATVIYRNLLAIAERHGEGKESHDAVLAVPMHFNEKQREDIIESATKAGFNVLRVITESSAAALAYDLGQTVHNETFNVLVYRLGGTTMDVTILEVNSGMYRVLASAASEQNAGKHITKALVDYFLSEFKRQWKADLREDRRAIAKLTSASEQTKHILSAINTATCSVESLHDGIDFQCSISRSRMEGMVNTMVQGCLRTVDDVLGKAGLVREDIDKVVVSGGVCSMPMVRTQILKMFPSAELLSNFPPDEVVAIGAAKQAGSLLTCDEEDRRQNERETRVPCLPGDILVECHLEGSLQKVPVLSKHTPVPTRRTKSFQLGEEQTSLTLRVFFADGDTEPLSLAKVCMKDLPAGSKVNGVFHVRSDGSLHLTCTEPSSNATQDVVIDGS